MPVRASSLSASRVQHLAKVQGEVEGKVENEAAPGGDVLATSSVADAWEIERVFNGGRAVQELAAATTTMQWIFACRYYPPLYYEHLKSARSVLATQWLEEMFFSDAQEHDNLPFASSTADKPVLIPVQSATMSLAASSTSQLKSEHQCMVVASLAEDDLTGRIEAMLHSELHNDHHKSRNDRDHLNRKCPHPGDPTHPNDSTSYPDASPRVDISPRAIYQRRPAPARLFGHPISHGAKRPPTDCRGNAPSSATAGWSLPNTTLPVLLTPSALARPQYASRNSVFLTLVEVFYNTLAHAQGRGASRSASTSSSSLRSIF
ncbi:uncharacterized protein BXZ73DRAFT_79479 [Epithele typhae]|uniref:uncharacterized protein n=1 Tax=Epithele typhae TaxID=378194 RepID=UPI002007A02A|nr:uncharacterized protein BXZ73DRAFT_79479 [Epithele typhae]KAH9923412.1 hypothetical protein BXZ73DRAFT_79479 [Epithele typhae]